MKILIKEKTKDVLYQFDWKKIPENKIRYLGFATLDPLGRVFEYKSNVYRGIYSNKINYLKTIFDCGLYNELRSNNLIIETQFTNKRTENFSLILKHKKLTTSMPTEWTFSMLKKAAKIILVTNTICEKYGYELGDAHPYNILFDKNKPVWVDIGSIIPKNTSWSAKTEFVNYTIVPLIFLAHGELLEAYSLLQAERYFKITSKNFRETVLFKKFLDLIGQSNSKNVDNLICESWIDSQCIDQKYNESFWENYQNNENELMKDMVNNKQNRFKRFFRISKLINKYAKDAQTILDLAGNTGLASLIIANKNKKIYKLINTDYDYNSIEKSVIFLNHYSRNKIESYLLNFMLPTHPDAALNFRSDLVLALAITHHLLLTQGFKIDEILQKIGSYSNKYVFIEFMPLGLWGGDKNSKPTVPSWYTIDWFKFKFKQHFNLLSIETIESHFINNKKEAHRILFIGKIK